MYEDPAGHPFCIGGTHSQGGATRAQWQFVRATGARGSVIAPSRPMPQKDGPPSGGSFVIDPPGPLSVVWNVCPAVAVTHLENDTAERAHMPRRARSALRLVWYGPFDPWSGPGWESSQPSAFERSSSVRGSVLVRLRAAAAVPAVLLGLAGCAGASQPAAQPKASHHEQGGQQEQPYQQLTIGQARAVFDAFWPRFEQLPANYTPATASHLAAGAELQAQLFFKGQSGPAITRLTKESFYVPQLTGYPRWFWAAAQEAGGRRDGHLFVMVQSAPSAPWKTAMALYDLGSNARMLHYLATTITTDAQGYAEAVSLHDSSLDIPPSGMPAAYSRYLDGTASQTVMRLFQSGPNTTGYLSLDRQISLGAGQYGWRDTDHQAPAHLPVYALRLRTHGAIVIFCTYDTSRWIAESSSAALPAQPSGSEADYVPPAFVAQGLGLTSVRAGARLTATAVDRVLAFVQPRKVGFIYILINNGAAIRIGDSLSAG